MILIFLLCLILLLEVKSNNEYQKDINKLYQMLIKQQQQINERFEVLKQQQQQINELEDELKKISR
jgi:hypothetical protein